MPDAPIPEKKPHVAYVAALLDDTEAAYTQAFVLIENSLQADFQRQPAQAVGFRSQIEAHLEEGQRRLALLQKAIAPWNKAKRKELGEDLSGRVEKFFALLEKGLAAVREQLAGQNEALESRRREIRQTLNEMGKQRQGLAGYKVKGKKSKLIHDEA